MVKVCDENNKIFKKLIAILKVKITVGWLYLMDIFFLISLTSSKLGFLWTFWAAMLFPEERCTKVKTS